MSEEIQKQRIAQQNRLLVTSLKAKVVEVYEENEENEEDESSKSQNIFSYKYEFEHPITNEIVQAYDDIEGVDVGEMIYDIGDEVDIMFTERLPKPGDDRTFVVRRTPIYPAKVNKKRKRAHMFSVLIFIIFSILTCLLCSGDPNNKQTNSKLEVIESTQTE